MSQGNGSQVVAPGVPVNRVAPRQCRKVALIGKAPSSVMLAPYDDPTWEIWILNTLGVLHEVPRWDRQYELHDIELTKDKSYGDYYPWLSQQSHGDRPVFLRDEPPEEFGAAARRYPLGEILRTFAHLAGVRYLTNTVSLMLAHVCYEHVTGAAKLSHLGLYGIDMAQHALKTGHAGWFTSEYARQRPSCEYWVGIAEGLGIQVSIPVQSDLLKTECIYGYHHTERFKKLEARRKELQMRVDHAQQGEQQKHDEAVYHSGFLAGMQYEFEPCKDCRDKRQQIINNAAAAERAKHDEAVYLMGACEDTNYLAQSLSGAD